MLTHLRKVGNSRGIIIPATLLNACKMVDEVDIRQEGRNVVIAPVKELRKGWLEGYKPELDTEPLASLPLDEDTEDWEW